MSNITKEEIELISKLISEIRTDPQIDKKIKDNIISLAENLISIYTNYNNFLKAQKEYNDYLDSNELDRIKRMSIKSVLGNYTEEKKKILIKNLSIQERTDIENCRNFLSLISISDIDEIGKLFLEKNKTRNISADIAKMLKSPRIYNTTENVQKYLDKKKMCIVM